MAFCVWRWLVMVGVVTDVWAAQDAWYPYKSEVWSKTTSRAHFLCSAGKMQSPVDLPVCEEEDVRPVIAISWGSHEIDLSNNGHSVQATIKGDGARTMRVNSKTYNLLQCHWHWGSEHTVGGSQKVLCAHCVHELTGTERYGVLGVFYNEGANGDPFLDLIKDHLPSMVRRLGSNPVISPFTGPVNFDLIHDKFQKNKYWTYSGSFTTPPCTEAVDWYPLMEYATVTSAQLQLFKDAIGWSSAGGNYRPPQPLHARDVQGCETSKWYPYNPSAWASAALTGTGAEICRNGQMQSPVDLPSCHERKARPAIALTWGLQTIDKLVNNQHSVKVGLPEGNTAAKMTVGNDVYTLLECHWHAGSEHTVADEQLPLVVHCVHSKDNNPYVRYGVLGIFYSVGASNPFLALFESELPQRARPPDATDVDVESSFVGSLDFDLLHKDLLKSNYWTYDGSLTTPPCSELVDWHILMDHATLTQAQLELMKTAIGWSGGNYRPPQELHGRKVEGCESVWYPYDSTYWGQQEDVCKTGREQSPIDLPNCIDTGADLPAISVAWGTENIDLENTGTSLKAKLKNKGTARMSVNGLTYKLEQCHWHWGSEHTVGGEQRDMVVHCVHKRDASTRYGVLGVFYEVNDAHAADTYLESIKVKVNEIIRDELGKTLSSDLDKVVETLALDKYWRYDGSLTTPPCSEVVDWYVLQQSQRLKQDQFKWMKAVIGWQKQGGNFRPPQPLHGREVLGCNAQSPVVMPTCGLALARTGLTVDWSVDDSLLSNENGILKFTIANGGTMSFDGLDYVLQYCELHLGSEHTGSEHDMSLQCYHKKDDNRMGAVSIQYKIQNKIGSQADEFLQLFENAIPTANNFVEQSLDFNKAIKNVNLKHFWTYKGSRTSTPFDEVVDWYVFMDVLPIRQAQFDKVQGALGSNRQIRPFQPRHSRKIEGCGAFYLPECDVAAEREAIEVTWGSSEQVKLTKAGGTVKISVTTGGKMKYGSHEHTLKYCLLRQGSGGIAPNSADLDLAMTLECAHEKDGSSDIAWFSVFYEVDGSNAEPFLALIEDQMPTKMTPEKSLTLDLSRAVANLNLEHYWTYKESHQKPQWYLAMKAQKMTLAQFDKFAAATDPLSSTSVTASSGYLQGCAKDFWYPYNDEVWSKTTSGAHFLCSAGKMQSPVDLPVCEEEKVRPVIAISWGIHEIDLSNNGHSVQATIKGDGARTMTVNSKTYKLLQCHWHWGSEHTVGGSQKVLCAHCVHELTGTGRYGVLGVLYDEGADADPFLDLIKDHLPSMVRRLGSDPIISTFTGPVNFDLIHDGMSKTKYWTYKGSFTTPPCTEAVDWYPLMEYATVTSAQLQLFKDAIGWSSAGGNYRPPQPLHARDVQGCETPKWYPYNPSAWASTSTAAEICRNGQMQSPVDLPSCHQKKARPAIALTWGIQTIDKLFNNQHTVQVGLPVGNTAKMTVGSDVYTLLQCHWHAGSEHTVAGEQLPLVVHCVHKKDGNLDRYGVLGIFYSVGASNPFLAIFENELPQRARRLATTVVESSFAGSLDFDLLHKDLSKSNYWTYDGSLTTPPCSELVDWHILMEHATLTQAQLDLMETAIGWSAAEGNYRPPQELHGRKVEGCDSTWYPYDSTYWGQEADVCKTGQAQSPIDLPNCIDTGADLPAISVSWGTENIDLENTGKGLKAKLRNKGTAQMSVNGLTYKLEQCHWHLGSEHTVGGEQRDMVVHCVHKRGGSTRYGVLGVFYEVNDAQAADTYLESIKVKVNEIISDELIKTFRSDLDKVVETLALDKYWRYDGSLTTPPCSEVVDWYVLHQSQRLKQDQFDWMQTVTGWQKQGGNFRPPQRLHGREVWGCNAQSPVVMPSCGFALARTGLTVGWSVTDSILSNGNGILKFEIANGGTMSFDKLDYMLQYCELRLGSEHTGSEHDMSLQCYHKKKDDNRVGAISIQYKIGSQVDEFLQLFENAIPTANNPVVKSLDWNKAIKDVNLKHFWTYKGSRTSTPFDEVVDWYVLMDVLPIRQAQFDKVEAALGSSRQIRPFQPRHSRNVEGCGVFYLPDCGVADERETIEVTWGSSEQVKLTKASGTVKISVTTGGKMKYGSHEHTLKYCQLRQGSGGIAPRSADPAMTLECAHEKDGSSDIAWFSVFYEVDGTNAEPFLALIEDQMPTKMNPEKSLTLDLNRAVASLDLKHYWTYRESYQKPQWYLAMKAQKMTQAQFDKFAAATDTPPSTSVIASSGDADDADYVQGCAKDVWYPYNGKVWSKTTSGAHFLCSAGKMQSPVDLPVCEEEDVRPPIAISWGSHQIDLSNNGHSIQAAIKGDGARIMEVNSKTYNLLQCHWHWGSEHTVGGSQKVLCAHCVHELTDTERYGVLGVLYNEGANGDPFLDLIKDDLPSMARRLASNSVTSEFKGPVDFDLIHNGKSKTEYWTYSGSFTTPPCTEAVDWYLLMEYATVTSAQLQLFQDAIGWSSARGNYRPPQPLHERDVQGCKTSRWYPFNPAAWASTSSAAETCRNGQMQSPVDLPSCHARKTRPAIALTWGVQTIDKLFNNQHTVQVGLSPANTAAKMTVGSDVYTLLQCHWHAGSEHTVAGKQLPLVVHCVHKKDDNSGKFGVLGIFYSVGASNPFLAIFESELPHRASPISGRRLAANDVVSSFEGNLNFDLLHKDLSKSNYWTYDGSLTTPPCSEVVDWNILMDHATLTQAQLGRMEAAIGWSAAKGNYRPPQELHGRNVEGCDSALYPYDSTYWRQKADVCKTGQEQSPIDLPNCIGSGADLPAISVSWGTENIDLINTGKGLKAKLITKGVAQMSVNGLTYKLEQCHWHWGSEHTVGGQQRDMVVHCVHKRDASERFGVVGVFYEVNNVQAADTYLESIEVKVQEMISDGLVKTLSSNLDKVVETLALNKYWAYDGSLTTPPCSEVVDWYVLHQSQRLKQAQLDLMKKVTGWQSEGGNFRPPQLLHGREVLGCNAQSPIVMPTCDVGFARTGLTVAWSVKDSLLSNENGILKFEIANGDKMSFGGSDYTLKYCEFRLGSEHTGSDHDMSLQCYHKKDGNSNRMGAVSIQYKIGSTADEFVQLFESDIPKANNPVVKSLDWFNAIKNVNWQHFWTYEGSTTSTPFDEVVDWYVLMDALSTTQAQFDKVKSALGSTFQIRPFQPRNSREVEGCGAFSLPECDSKDEREAIKVTWGSKQVKLTKAGGTVKISVTSGGKMKYGSHEYTLKYCQVRQGSGGIAPNLTSLALTVECAHEKDGSSVTAWFSIFYEVDGSDAEPFLALIEDQLPTKTNPVKSLTLDVGLAVANMNLNNYWTYIESAQQPQWYLLMKVQKMTQAQFDKFAAATDSPPSTSVITPPDGANYVQGCSTTESNIALGTIGSIYATLQFVTVSLAIIFGYQCA